MSNNPPFYSDEAVLLSWGESPKDGAWIKLQIREDLIPDLRGLKRGAEHGERFAVVIVGPLASDEHTNLGLGEGASGERPAQSRDKGATEETGAMRANPPSPKPKRRWQDMPASQRAALLTSEPDFWRYLGTRGVAEPSTAVAADASLKFLCNIQSKRELDERHKAAVTFERLCGDFKAWQQARGHGVI